MSTTASRISGQPGHGGAFTVPSKSHQDDPPYTVFWQHDELAYCPCPAFTHRRTCRHVDAVNALVTTEVRAQQAASTAASRAEAEATLAGIREMFER